MTPRVSHKTTFGRRQAHRLQQFDAGDRGGAGAVDHHLDLVERAAGQVQGVDQPGGGDDRGAVLVVMKDRDVEQFAQPLLDDEAFRRLDVFEIDAAKSRVQIAHAIDKGVDVARVDFEIDRIDIGKALEQRRLAFHDRLCRERPKIAETEHRGAVRDHGDEIALRGVVEGGTRTAFDFEARKRDTRRIGERQVALRRQRFVSARSRACLGGRWSETTGLPLRSRELCRYPYFSTLLAIPARSAAAVGLLARFNLKLDSI